MATRRQTPAGPVATVAVQSEEVEGILEDSFAVSLPSPCTSGQEGERTQVDGQTASNELECGLAGISQGRLAWLLASFHALNQIFGRLETSSIHPIHMCHLAQGGQKQLPKCTSRPICSALVSVHGGSGQAKHPNSLCGMPVSVDSEWLHVMPELRLWVLQCFS